MGIDRYFAVSYYDGLFSVLEKLVEEGMYMDNWEDAYIAESSEYKMTIRYKNQVHFLEANPVKNMLFIDDTSRYYGEDEEDLLKVKSFFSMVTGDRFDVYSEHTDKASLTAYPRHTVEIRDRLKNINMESAEKRVARIQAKNTLKQMKTEMDRLHKILNKMDDMKLAFTALAVAKTVEKSAHDIVGALESYIDDDLV
jgi:hypothetical protein